MGRLPRAGWQEDRHDVDDDVGATVDPAHTTAPPAPREVGKAQGCEAVSEVYLVVSSASIRVA